MTNTLHVKTTGSGPPLVLLHGWGWNLQIWDPLIPQLERLFSVYQVDLPGFGQSPFLTSSYAIQEVVAELFNVLPDTATWLGWSLGGMIAWWTALNYPNKITRLITVATSPKFVAENGWPGVTPQVLEKFSYNLKTDFHKTLSDFLELQLRGSPNHENLLLELTKQLPPRNSQPPAALFCSLNLLSNLDFRSDLQKIRCPSLHIYGSHDTLVPKEVATLLQPLLPDSRFEIIKRTGHMPFLTHPDFFLELLSN